jgi:hypothetical protein
LVFGQRGIRIAQGGFFLSLSCQTCRSIDTELMLSA